jgi:hypothetical protein
MTEYAGILRPPESCCVRRKKDYPEAVLMENASLTLLSMLAHYISNLFSIDIVTYGLLVLSYYGIFQMSVSLNEVNKRYYERVTEDEIANENEDNESIPDEVEMDSSELYDDDIPIANDESDNETETEKQQPIVDSTAESMCSRGMSDEESEDDEPNHCEVCGAKPVWIKPYERWNITDRMCDACNINSQSEIIDETKLSETRPPPPVVEYDINECCGGSCNICSSEDDAEDETEFKNNQIETQTQTEVVGEAAPVPELQAAAEVQSVAVAAAVPKVVRGRGSRGGRARGSSRGGKSVNTILLQPVTI